MYDTVSFHTFDSSKDFFECVKSSNFMKSARANVLPETGEIFYYYICNIGDIACNVYGIASFNIEVYQNGIYISGSLPRLLYPDNTFVLTLGEVKQALDILSNFLHIDVGELNVTRIDIAGTFSMDMPVGNYLDCLGHLSRWKRILMTDGETLYYRQGNKKYERVLCFYDKNKESMEKRGMLPSGVKGENLLRYEARWHGNLPKRFKVPEVKGKDLHDEQFYQKLMQGWKDIYDSIEKKPVISVKEALPCVKTVDDAVSYLLAKALHHAPVDIAENTVQELKANKNFKHSQDYSRLRKAIKQVTDFSGMMHESELAVELDEKIKAIVDASI